MSGEYRIEHDTMGEVRVPADALWAAQTQRAVENFPISGHGLEAAQIVALARIKRAAALVNGELGVLQQDVVDAIVGAADEVIDGQHLDQFPIDVYQTGSGTSSNMNMNEVLAALATRRLGRSVHPNDAVNASQSSNDVFPTSVHVAATEAMLGDLVPALDHLASSLEAARERVGGAREARPHAPHGRDPGDLRSGVRRLRPADPARHRPGAGRACRASRRCRSAARRPARASTPRRASPPR